MSAAEASSGTAAPALRVTPDFRAYEARMAAAIALEAENLAINKAALFAALETAGI